MLKVIIKKWQANDNVETLRNTDNNNITSYEHSKQGRLPYVTYLQEGYESGKLIVIGNGSEIEKNRRKRATTRYQNAPLEEGTEYALFVRVFYNDLEVSDNICKTDLFNICVMTRENVPEYILQNAKISCLNPGKKE